MDGRRFDCVILLGLAGRNLCSHWAIRQMLGRKGTATHLSWLKRRMTTPVVMPEGELGYHSLLA